jgi:hypothetical protein
MAKCEICEREFKTLIGLSKHIRVHKIKPEEYYLSYINPIKGKCKICGKDTTFVNMIKGYYDYCGVLCLSNDPDIKEKRKNTYYEKTGFINPSQNPDIKIQKENTYYEKTGFINPSQNPEVIKKKEENNLEKTGYKHHMHNPDEVKKLKESNFEKTGYNHPLQNPEIIKKRENKCFEKNGYKHPSQNPEVAKKISDSHKYTFHDIEENYPDLIRIENLIEGPNGETLGHCKNANCSNSEENGGYFIITTDQIISRNHGINSVKDGYYLYCCEECKKECILFGRSANQLDNIFNPQIDELSKASPQELAIWRNEVFKRQKIENLRDDNFCEICHSTASLHCHHELPQKLYPGYALDPDNGIVLCSECHNKYGHEKGSHCSTGSLANKNCK